MGKKTEREEDRIFKPPESPHFQTAADNAFGMITSRLKDAPICAGGASPLRVATGGNANWSSGVRSRHSPARANRRRDNVSGDPGEASLLRSSEKHDENLTHIGHLFMTKPRASLRSDNCPISFGMSARFELEQVSAFVGIRSRIAQRGHQPPAPLRRGAAAQPALCPIGLALDESKIHPLLLR